jgi:DNA replication protein DnaC
MEIVTMSIDDAFLSPFADDLFSAVAGFGDAQALQTFDVADFQKPARQAIDRAINNALNSRNHNPGSRIALIKGDAGSGKSHVLTTTFKRAASMKEVYPAVLQLTAPVTVRSTTFGYSMRLSVSSRLVTLSTTAITVRCGA